MSWKTPWPGAGPSWATSGRKPMWSATRAGSWPTSGGASGRSPWSDCRRRRRRRRLRLELGLLERSQQRLQVTGDGEPDQARPQSPVSSVAAAGTLAQAEDGSAWAARASRSGGPVTTVTAPGPASPSRYDGLAVRRPPARGRHGSNRHHRLLEKQRTGVTVVALPAASRAGSRRPRRRTKLRALEGGAQRAEQVAPDLLEVEWHRRAGERARRRRGRQGGPPRGRTGARPSPR